MTQKYFCLYTFCRALEYTLKSITCKKPSQLGNFICQVIVMTLIKQFTWLENSNLYRSKTYCLGEDDKRYCLIAYVFVC